MNEIPPVAPLPINQRNADADHLMMLSIFHFVGAGLALLGILFLFLHFIVMHFMFTDAALWQDQKDGPPPAQFFAIFEIFYFVAGAWFVASGVLNLLSGIFLQARKYRMFSLVVAGLNCIHIPLGTVLGIFTIVVLTRGSVQEMYEASG